VARVRVTTSDETYTLERTDGGWGLAEKGGYPVDVDKVKALVVGLTELELVEEKTANPALFARLGVQDPGAEGDTPSRRVELLDASGSVLADLVVGREMPARGAGDRHVYVRRPERGPALEAKGSVRVDDGSAALLDREIAKLERKRVARVTTIQPDGEVLRVERPSADVADFTVVDLPEGAELAWPGVAGGVAGALEYLNLEDVRPADAPFDQAAAVRTRFEAFDGLVLETESVEEEGRVVMRVRASFEPALRPTEPAGPPAAEGESAPATELVSVEEVEAQVAEINARVGDWLYVVPGYAGSNLRKRMADLLAQPEEDAEPLLPFEPMPPDDEHADPDHGELAAPVEDAPAVDDGER
ncbi:MAG TPA: DUF4340 domain-containing protein, partial [Planctomycetota bacterium]|nr:DUF4340 domain-containing protein [Planctomycetota bacterium]